jgi:rare lipoprotein A
MNHSVKMLAFALLLIGCLKSPPAPPVQNVAAAAPVPAASSAEPTRPSEQPAPGALEPVAQAKVLSTSTGKATYSSDALAGRKTASGERYDPAKLTAAHRSLPFGTLVRVTRLDQNVEVVVRVNDRGPFAEADRIIDVSRSAAERLGMLRAGVVPVRLDVLERPSRK